MSLLLPSLYMLKIVILPHPLLSCMTVTLLDGNAIWFQLSVLISDYTRIMDLVLSGLLLCVVGYTGIQSLDTIKRLKALIAGS